MPTENPPQNNHMEKAQLEQELKTIEKGIKFAKTREILERYLNTSKGKSFESQVKKLVAGKYDELVKKGVIADKKSEIKKFKEANGIDAKSLAVLPDESVVQSTSVEPVAVVASIVAQENTVSPEKKIIDELIERGFSQKSLGSIIKKYGSDTAQKLHASGKTYEEYKGLKPAEKKAIFAVVVPDTTVVAPEAKNTDSEKEKIITRYHFLNNLLFGKDTGSLSVPIQAAAKKEWDEMNVAHADIIKAERARYGVDRDGFRMNSEENWQILKGLGYTAEDAIKWTKHEYETILNNKIKKGDPVPSPVAPKVKSVEPAGKILSPEQAKAQIELKDRGFPYEYIKSLPEESQKNLAASGFFYLSFQKLVPAEQSAVFHGEKKFESTAVEKLAEINKNYEVTEGDLDRILHSLNYDKKMLKGMNADEKMSAAKAILEGGLTKLGYTQKDIEDIPLRRQGMIVRLGIKKENFDMNHGKAPASVLAKGPVSPAKNISEEQKLDTLVDRGFKHGELATNKFLTSERIEQLYTWGGTSAEFDKMSPKERQEKIFGIPSIPTPVATPVLAAAPVPAKMETLIQKETKEDLISRGFKTKDLNKMPADRLQKLHAWGGSAKVFDKMSFDDAERIVFNADHTPIPPTIPSSPEKKIDNELTARGFSNWYIENMSPEDKEKIHAWGGPRDVYEKMTQTERMEKVFGEKISQPTISSPAQPAGPTGSTAPATPVPPVVPPAQGPRSKTPAQLETERLEKEFQMTTYGASYLDKATGTVYFVEHAEQQEDGSVLLHCRLSNGGKGMLRKDKLLRGVEIGAYEQVDQQKFLEEQVNTTRTIYTTEYKDNLNSSWWKRNFVKPTAGLGESLGLWRRDSKAFLSNDAEQAKEKYDNAKQELAKFADRRAKEKIIDPARIKKIEDGLKRRAAAKGEQITSEQLKQEVENILARYRRTILGHGIAIAETRKVHETQKGLFRSTTAESIGKAVKWYGGLSKTQKFLGRTVVYTAAGISGMGAAAALGYGVYRGVKSLAMSGLFAQATHLYRATIDKALVGMSDSSLSKKKNNLQEAIQKGEINILDYEKQMSNLGLKKNKHDAMRRTAQVGVAFALGWESYKVLDQLENTDWTITPTPGPIPDEGGVDDIDPVPPTPPPAPEPEFHLDRPTVEFSSKGAIRTFLELKENLKDQLEDQHIALNDPNLPPSVKEILNGDPTELAIKYDYYNPADTNESALLTLHGKLGFDENMNLVHMEPNGDNTILADGYDNMKGDFDGKYLDTDYGSKIEIGSPAEELEKMKGASLDGEGVPIESSPAEELEKMAAAKLTPDQILAQSMGVDHVDTIKFDGPGASGEFAFKYDADGEILGGKFLEGGDIKPIDLSNSEHLRSNWKEIIQNNSELPIGEAEEKLKGMIGQRATLEDVRDNLPKTPDYDDERHYLDEKIKDINNSIDKDFGPVVKIDFTQAQYDQMSKALGRSFIVSDAEGIFGNRMGQWDELSKMPADVAMDKIFDENTDLYDNFSGKQVTFIEDIARPLITEANIEPLSGEDFGTYLARLESKSPEIAKAMAEKYNLKA